MPFKDLTLTLVGQSWQTEEGGFLEQFQSGLNQEGFPNLRCDSKCCQHEYERPKSWLGKKMAQQSIL